MKKILLSLMVMFAMTASAAIDLNDPATYTVKEYDFVNTITSGLSIGSTNCGTAYETGNAKNQIVYNCTAPAALVDVFAFQGIAGSKGTRLTTSGMQNLSATRSAAILGLKAGQVVVFVNDGAEIDVRGGGTGEGTHEATTDGNKQIVTMTSDGNLGFCIAKNHYLKSVSIYTEKVAGVCTAPEAKITGTDGTARVITLSDAEEDAKIYWAESEEGDYALYTAPVTTSAETIYFYADNGAKSEVVSFTTGAGSLVKLNGVTVTRISDYTCKFEASQVGVVGEPTPVIKYTIKDGEVLTAASGETVHVNGDIKAWTEVEGYTKSDVTEVKFVAPFVKGGLATIVDFITYGGNNAGLNVMNEASTTVKDCGAIDGDYMLVAGSDDKIYLQQVANASGDAAWLYRSGKANSNFKCQNADAYMVFDVEAGQVIEFSCGNDNSAKAPLKGAVNATLGCSYGSTYQVMADKDGFVGVLFSTGSMIMEVKIFEAIQESKLVAAINNAKTVAETLSGDVKSTLLEAIDVAQAVFDNATDSSVIVPATEALNKAVEDALAATSISSVNVATAKVAKAIENGKVVIVKNGKKISVAGVEL